MHPTYSAFVLETLKFWAAPTQWYNPNCELRPCDLATLNLKLFARNQISLHRHLSVWLIYLALAILLTWPVVTQLTTHLPGDGGDDPAIAWNLWWIKYALLNAGQNPFSTDFMFHPIGINLAYYTLTTLNGLTVLPLTLLAGVVAASNLHMLFTFAAGGYGVFLLTRYLLSTSLPNDNYWPAVAAGIFYAFAGSKLFYVALGQFNIAGTHWIPFAALYTVRARRNPGSLKDGLMVGLFLTMQAWTELTYASFLVIFMAMFWLYWLIIDRGRNLPAHLRAMTLTGVSFTLGLSPILAHMLPDMLAEGDFLVEGGGFADSFSADLLGFVIPTMHHPWLGQLVTQTGIVHFSKGQHIYLGIILLGLALVSMKQAWRQPEWRFWLLASGLFALLCLGPVITVNGSQTGLPGPFVILQKLPFFKGNRYPSRYSVMLLLSLSVTAAFALRQISRRPARSFIIPLIAALFLVEHLSLPLPQSDMRLPPAYPIIANDTDDFTVLDIPFAWRNGFRITGALTAQFMFGQFYQTYHQKPMLQGNTSRNPEFKFQYFTEAPILNSLLALETGRNLPQAQWQADRAIAADALRFFDIKYIVVRSNPGNNPIVTPQAAIPYIESVLPVEKIHNAPDIKIYRVDQSTCQSCGNSPTVLINTGSPLTPLYLGEGWGRHTPGEPLVAQRHTARLLTPLTGGMQRVSLRIQLPPTYDETNQTVWLTLNGWQSPPQTIGRNWQTIAFDLPPGAAQPGLNNLTLHFDRTATVPPTVSPPNIVIVSAGQEVGDFGHIYLNGREISPNERGYNVALIAADGRLLDAAHFDTHLNPAASAALTAYLQNAPAQAIIAIAAADEASANLSAEAEHALQAVGASGNLRDCFRCSHAILHQPNNATRQALDPLRPVSMSAGLGLTEPTIAAAIDWIEIESIAK